MTFARNQYFNNPAFGQAAAKLTALFAPPSGSDAAGWAAARAKQEEANRLAQFFTQSQDPNVDLDALSRTGLGVGAYDWRGSKYGVDQGNATQRYGYDTSAQAQRDVAGINNAGAMERQLASPVILNQGQRAYLPPAVAENVDLAEILEGAPKPLSETEWKAGHNQRLLDSGQLTDDALIDAIVGGQTPVKAIDPRTKQPAFMSPGAAVRQGAQPYEAASAERVDNYLAVGPSGEEVRFPGMVGPNGQIINANTGQVVPNVIRKEGTGGGMSFEVDGQGGVRFTTGGAGGTVSNTTSLLGSERENRRVANELSLLYDTISAADVGVAGNVNQFLTDYGAQLFPGVERSDVAAMRSQLEGMSIQLARTLSGDSRISNMDREVAQRVMVDRGLGESLPGARAKLATLVVLHAYRSAFASDELDGDQLPPIDGRVLGQLVDRNLVSPAVASEFQQTVLSRRAGRPVQTFGNAEMDRMAGEAAGAAGPPAADATPAGVDPADWEFMTPEQKALFQ